MIQQQQVRPLSFGRKMSDSDDESQLNRGSDTSNESVIQSSVIKETESVRKMIRRSVSPSEDINNDDQDENDLMVALSPTSIVAKTTITTVVPRYIKRSSSIDDDDELYENDRIIKQRHKRYSDPEPLKDRDDEYDYKDRYTTDDDDGPLDLSLPSERRRHHNYSDTESDDSAGLGDDKATGKAAYKKNLMKRYRKLKTKACNDFYHIFLFKYYQYRMH